MQGKHIFATFVEQVKHTLQYFKGSHLALTMHAGSHLEGKVPEQQHIFLIKDQQHEFISKAQSLQC